MDHSPLSSAAKSSLSWSLFEKKIVPVETALARRFRLRRRDVETLIDRTRRNMNTGTAIASVNDLRNHIALVVSFIETRIASVRAMGRVSKKAGKVEMLHALAEVVLGTVHIVADVIESPYSVHSYAIGAGGVALGVKRLGKGK